MCVFLRKGARKNIARKQIAVSPSTDKQQLATTELYNWCGEVLERIGKCAVKTEDEVYKYVYQLLAVMYRCSKDGKPSLLHINHRKIIEENLTKAMAVFFSHYGRYQDEVLKVEAKEEESSASASAAGTGLNRHMFCKYPFLKPLLSQQLT